MSGLPSTENILQTFCCCPVANGNLYLLGDRIIFEWNILQFTSIGHSRTEMQELCVWERQKKQLGCCGKDVVFGMEGTPGKWQEKVEVGD